MPGDPAAADWSVEWTEMRHGTKVDYERLDTAFTAHARGALVGNLTNILGMLAGPTLGYQIDRYQHSLQSATRALRNDESVDLIVGALLHDIGDAFAPENHSEAAGAMLAPYLDERTTWIIKHHGIFQGYYWFHHMGGDRDARERYVTSPHYDACVQFCAEYDQNCFDPNYDTLPIEAFDEHLAEVFSRTSQVPGVASP